MKKYLPFFIVMALILTALFFGVHHYLEKKEAERIWQVEIQERQARQAQKKQKEEILHTLTSLDLSHVKKEEGTVEEEEDTSYLYCTDFMVTKNELRSADCALAIELFACGEGQTKQERMKELFKRIEDGEEIWTLRLFHPTLLDYQKQIILMYECDTAITKGE